MYLSNCTAPPNSCTVQVNAPDGTQLYPNVKDANGNFFSADVNGNIIDTLGRTPVLKTVSGSQTFYDILNSQNTRSRYTVTWATIPVHTAFGQTGIPDCGDSSSCTITVATRLDLPDGSFYAFNYDQGTTAGNYGEMISMQVPTGATINYGYTTFQDAYGNKNRWVSSRTKGSGMWTYTPAVITTCTQGQTGCKQKLTVTKPSGDNTVYTFTLNNGAWNSQVDTYTGAVSGTPQQSIATTYDFSNLCGQSCNGALYIRATNAITTMSIPGSATIQKQISYSYDNPQNGNVVAIKEWKYIPGANAFGAAPDRETDIAYKADASYVAINDISLPISTTTKDSAGNPVAQTTIAYDEPSLTLVSGAFQHDDTNFGISYTTRGNPTTICRMIGQGTCSGSNGVFTHLSYDTTGQLIQTTDNNNNSTTFSYADNFYNDDNATPPQIYNPTQATNAYLKTATLPIIGAMTYGYYYGSGKPAVSTDQNGADAYSHYMDSLDRLTSQLLPTTGGNRGWQLNSYAANPPALDTYASINDTTPATTCSSCVHSKITLDTFGRTSQTSLVSDPDGQTYVDFIYDPSSRPFQQKNPHRSGTLPTDGTTTTAYDGLGRVTSVTEPDGAVVHAYYGPDVSSNGGNATQLPACTTYGLGYPTLTVDEAGKKRQTWTDGFGRMIEADEPDSSNTLTVATCYAYDLLNNLTNVTAGSQTRSYTYDYLSRLTSETLPESGVTHFYYVTTGGALCSGSASNICRRTDARSITTTYTYDALNRLTQISYSDGTTPLVSYFYDQTSYNGLTITNGKGRRTGMSDESGQTAWSYDTVGRILSEKRTNTSVTPSVTKTISYTYDLGGDLKTITYPTGRVLTYTYSNAGRQVSAVDSTNSVNYATTATYAPFGALATVVQGGDHGFAGTTLTQTFTNRLFPNNITASNSYQTVLNLSYLFNANGTLQKETNNLDNSRTQSFTYDYLNRLASGQSPATWGNNYGYDQWGNLLSKSLIHGTSENLSITVDPTTNHITTTPYAYNLDGALTNDGVHASTYTYDAENRITNWNTTNFTYDGDNLRVYKSGWRLYWRGGGIQVLSETNTSGAPQKEFVFFAGRRIADLEVSSGNRYYYYNDQLGSARAITNGSGSTTEWSMDYFPWGAKQSQPINNFDNRYRFSGQEYDTENGNYYFPFRYYTPTAARFLSADPADLAAANVTNPQSWNKYSYVLNLPIMLTDTLGLCDSGQADANGNCPGDVPTIHVEVWSYFDPVPKDCDPTAGCDATVPPAPCAYGRGRLSSCLGDEKTHWWKNFAKSFLKGFSLKSAREPGETVLQCVARLKQISPTTAAIVDNTSLVSLGSWLTTGFQYTVSEAVARVPNGWTQTYKVSFVEKGAELAFGSAKGFNNVTFKVLPAIGKISGVIGAVGTGLELGAYGACR